MTTWPTRSALLAVLLATNVVACSAPAPAPTAPRVAVQDQPVLPAPHRETAGDLDWNAEEAPLLVRSQSQHATVFDGLGEFPSFPLPQAPAPALGTEASRATFAQPLPASPVWNPPGQKRVGIQAGHWLTYDVPSELSRLSAGASAGGWDEWEVNLRIGQHVKRILEEAGVQVDLLPAAIPSRYRAHAFVSIHADGDTSGTMHGYKLARPGFSSIPDTDDKLVEIMYREYGAATGLARDSDAHISRRMTYYYAFNARRYEHAIDLGTPAVIVETGFLTHAGDRAFLTGRPEVAAQGIANGILRFLDLEIGAVSTAG
jgi:N-acetylmuramoyl-L-alanine amidase